MPNVVRIPVAAGAFDPTDITITDNTSGAFLIQDSATEYYRINSSATSARYDLKTGLGNQYLIQSGAGSGETLLRNGVYNLFYMQGSESTRAQVKFFTHEQYSGGYFRSRDSGGAEIFRVDEDSNATFTLNDSNSAVFKVQDDAGTPHEYFKVDTTSGQPGVTIKMPTGVPLRFQADQYQALNSSGSVYRAFNITAANNWSFGDTTGSSPGYLQGYASDIRIVHQSSSGSNSGVKMRARGAGTGDTFKIQSNTETNFEIDQDSNATFTLDETSGAVFKVVDDAASPNTYLKAVEAGSVSTERNFEIYNSTAPAASVTDGCILFCEDVSSSSELKVRDEAGNVTTLSPHNFSLIPEGPSEEMAWSYYSEKDGKKINVDMLRLARLVEQISGEKIIFEEG